MNSSGNMFCWGPDDFGQLGDQTNNDSNIALRVTGIQATAISAGSSQSCALLSDGSVRCWGYGGWGDLGDGKSTESLVPVTVQLSSSASAIASGGDHSCAILTNANSTIQCWGYNSYGQVGDGTSGTNRPAPVNVLTLTQAKSIACGTNHSCAIVAGGAVYCWGDSELGQLGTGNSTQGTVPGLVSGF
jgi:alpha-tubulin suppressor-like RCC1 family protein